MDGKTQAQNLKEILILIQKHDAVTYFTGNETIFRAFEETDGVTAPNNLRTTVLRRGDIFTRKTKSAIAV